MLKSWYDIYSERMNEQYRVHLASKYATFLQMLHEHQGEVTTEIGCGAGNITRLLREMENPNQLYYHHLTDSCPRMLGLAVENNPTPRCSFYYGDITKSVPANCDLVHSHGLLEHFDDYTIRHVVHSMRHTAPVQIHYVPSAMYKTPSRGDERLLCPDEWREILSPFKKVTIKTFNYGLDIILRIET